MSEHPVITVETASWSRIQRKAKSDKVNPSGTKPLRRDVNSIAFFCSIPENVSTKEKIDIQSYLASKWDLESETDSDGDGFVDSVEISNNSKEN